MVVPMWILIQVHVEVGMNVILWMKFILLQMVVHKMKIVQMHVRNIVHQIQHVPRLYCIDTHRILVVVGYMDEEGMLIITLPLRIRSSITLDTTLRMKILTHVWTRV